jgi:roadblock/LC7 domain-containing protein
VSLASKLLAVLGSFRQEVAQQVNSGQLLTIDDHIDRVASVIDSDIAAADAKAKEVLAELYTALHGAADTTPDVDAAAAPVATTPAPPAATTPAPGAEPTPVLQEPAPVQAAPVAEPAAPVDVAPVETPAS